MGFILVCIFGVPAWAGEGAQSFAGNADGYQFAVALNAWGADSTQTEDYQSGCNFAGYHVNFDVQGQDAGDAQAMCKTEDHALFRLPLANGDHDDVTKGLAGFEQGDSVCGTREKNIASTSTTSTG